MQVSKAWTTKDKGEKLGARLTALLKHPLTIQWIVYVLLFWCADWSGVVLAWLGGWVAGLCGGRGGVGCHTPVQ